MKLIRKVIDWILYDEEAIVSSLVAVWHVMIGFMLGVLWLGIQ